MSMVEFICKFYSCWLLLLLLLAAGINGRASAATVVMDAAVGEHIEGTVANGNMLTVSYDITRFVTLPYRLSTHAPTANLSHPVFVSVRQGRHITSWTIPYIEDSHGFLSVQRTLCPILNGIYNSSSNTSAYIHIDVSSPAMYNQTVSISLDYVEEYILSTNSSVDVTVSAPSPVFYAYEYPDDESIDDVQVVVTSDSNVCAIVSVQDGLCPNDLLLDYPSQRGVFQTMEKLSAITYQRPVHQDFFYVVVTILHDDWCAETTRDLIDGLVKLNTSAQYNPVSIHSGELYTDPKNITISIRPKLSRSRYWIRTVISFVIYLLAYIIIFVWILIDWCYCFKRKEQYKKLKCIVLEELIGTAEQTDCDSPFNDDTKDSPKSTPFNDDTKDSPKNTPFQDDTKDSPKSTPVEETANNTVTIRRPKFISVLKGNHWLSEINRITDTPSPKGSEYVNEQFTKALLKLHPKPVSGSSGGNSNNQTRSVPPPLALQSQRKRSDSQPLLESNDSPDHAATGPDTHLLLDHSSKATDALNRQTSCPARTRHKANHHIVFWSPANSRSLSNASDSVSPTHRARRKGLSESHDHKGSASPTRRARRKGLSESHDHKDSTLEPLPLYHAKSYDRAMDKMINTMGFLTPPDSSSDAYYPPSSDLCFSNRNTSPGSDSNSSHSVTAQSLTPATYHAQEPLASPDHTTTFYAQEPLASPDPTTTFYAQEPLSSPDPTLNAQDLNCSTRPPLRTVMQNTSGFLHEETFSINTSSTQHTIATQHTSHTQGNDIRHLQVQPLPLLHKNSPSSSGTWRKLPGPRPTNNFSLEKHTMSDLALPEGEKFQQRYEGYWAFLISVVMFYAIPTYQLLLTYQKYLNFSGNQDFCYYNNLCSHRLGVFSAFNNIWSNVGFLMLGSLFLILTWRRREQYRYFEQVNVRFADHHDHKIGIPQHFGIYYAVGVALMGEGVMSAAYHICPTGSNYQFDTTMMFVLVTLGLYKLYECRNPDKYSRPHVLLLVLSLMILLIGLGVLYSYSLWFYVVFFIIFETIATYTSLQNYYRWIKINSCKQFKEVLMELFCNVIIRPGPPQHKMKFFYLLVSLAVNWMYGLYLVTVRPKDFGTYFLVIMIINFLLSLIYYVIAKLWYRECQKHNPFSVIRPLIYLSLSLVMWISGIFLYQRAVTNWLKSPSGSRNDNEQCILLDFFDSHDLWHFISAFALFFSFLLLMSLDDNQENTNRNRLHIF